MYSRVRPSSLVEKCSLRGLKKDRDGSGTVKRQELKIRLLAGRALTESDARSGDLQSSHGRIEAREMGMFFPKLYVRSPIIFGPGSGSYWRGARFGRRNRRAGRPGPPDEEVLKRLRGHEAREREATIPSTRSDAEIERSLEIGLPAAESVGDRTISTFVRTERPHFAGPERVGFYRERR